jgi:hypothetical protein
MLTLHKLQEGFIVTSEETPKGSDLIIWTGNTVEHFPKQGTPQIKYGCIVESVNYSGTTHKDWKKVIAQQDQIDFSSLSEEEQKEIGWFDVEELALNETSDIDNSQFDRGVIYGFHKGFKKAVELLSDRRFTGEDLANYLNFVEDYYYYHSDTWYDRDTDEPVKRATMFFKFKSQLKSWEIEVEMEPYTVLEMSKLPLGTVNAKPKFTNGKLKILKIK